MKVGNLEIRKHTHPRPFTPTIQLYCAIALFFVVTYMARGTEMTEIELRIFNAIYMLPEWLKPVFLAVTQLGSIYVLGALLIGYLLWQRYRVVLRLLLTGLLAYSASGFAKDIWGRPRPTELLPDIVMRDFLIRGPGYPSGHAALATALALTVGHYLPKKYRLWVIIAWITGVGLSRIYLGVHAPLDVLGGIAIGWGCYALFRHVALRDLTKKSSKREKNHINDRL